MRLLLSGLDTVDCAYYLVPAGQASLDFQSLREQREAYRLAKTRDPLVVELGGMECWTRCCASAPRS